MILLWFAVSISNTLGRPDALEDVGEGSICRRRVHRLVGVSADRSCRTLADTSLLIWRFTSASANQGVSLSEPFSTRSFISEYAVSMSLLSAAAFVAVPGLSFTWRMNLPLPCNKRAGSGSAAP